MKVKKNIYKIILTLVLIGAIVAVGVFSYRSGVSYGIAQNIDVEALQEGAVPFMRGMNHYGMHPGMTGFKSGGFTFMRILGGLFFLFIIVGLIRKLFFRRSFAHWPMHAPGRRFCGNGTYEGDVPSYVAEMHKKLHEDLKKEDEQDKSGDEQASAA